EIGEIDALLEGDDAEEGDELPVLDENAEVMTRPGDIWVLGSHRIICADACDPSSYERLLGEEKAQMVFADPPYHAIYGTGSGPALLRDIKFAVAAGQVSPRDFENFLQVSLGHAARHSVDGAIHFVCTDWRYLHELLTAAQEIYAAMLDLCVWSKPKAKAGSLYRSQHELVLVFKVGTGSHIDHIGLGKHGRNRSNVWNYASQDALMGTGSKFSPYPTVKPVALVADAIRDCSDRQGIILDPFGGAGTS